MTTFGGIYAELHFVLDKMSYIKKKKKHVGFLSYIAISEFQDIQVQYNACGVERKLSVNG